MGFLPGFFRVFILPVLPFVLIYFRYRQYSALCALSAVIKDKGGSAGTGEDDNVVEVEYEIVDDEDDCENRIVRMFMKITIKTESPEATRRLGVDFGSLLATSYRPADRRYGGW